MLLYAVVAYDVMDEKDKLLSIWSTRENAEAEGMRISSNYWKSGMQLIVIVEVELDKPYEL